MNFLLLDLAVVRHEVQEEDDEGCLAQCHYHLAMLLTQTHDDDDTTLRVRSQWHAGITGLRGRVQPWLRERKTIRNKTVRFQYPWLLQQAFSHSYIHKN